MLKEKLANSFEKPGPTQLAAFPKVAKALPEQKSQKAKKGGERSGDWICQKCSNHNYSFRSFCNRCNLSQVQSNEMLAKKAPFRPQQMSPELGTQSISTPFSPKELWK
mmetsp:Transcript_1009/g.1818  ORF Transcript_1009/g.1818 Transcript_1009/m.1818 type:complete len:108 (+) Transcript_1009:1290-1613(+)